MRLLKKNIINTISNIKICAIINIKHNHTIVMEVNRPVHLRYAATFPGDVVKWIYSYSHGCRMVGTDHFTPWNLMWPSNRMYYNKSTYTITKKCVYFHKD